MKKNKPKIVVILGPTASGKSDIAISIAKEFDGEIISADSRQIYRGMDIGTGKVEGIWDKEKKTLVSEGIPHYAIDIANPNENFNVSDFKKYSEKKIKNILSRKKLPIICGGTGFWIKAVVDNVDFPSVAPDPILRSLLSSKTTDEIFEKLQKLDPERARTIDSKNKIRLIRAIEICNALGSVPKNNSVKESPYEFLQIGIKIDKNILDERIQKRLDSRFSQGMIREVEKMHKSCVSWEKLESFGLEYRNIAQFLQNKVSEKEMKEKLYFDILHYAKRQMTWFQKNKNIIWLESFKDIKKEVRCFIEK